MRIVLMIRIMTNNTNWFFIRIIGCIGIIRMSFVYWNRILIF